MTDLTWNGSDYQCELEDGRTFYVSGDAWAEARLERARCYYSKKHPELSQDEVNEALAEGNEEAQACSIQATEELLNYEEWTSCAVAVDDRGLPRDPNVTWHFDAWIQ